ncbi:hypothetical protein TNCV_43891 [Trichonephila clavipes]|nr:hypothetical protein TNCV_43891 [Trichonephila clavipes]
MGTQTTFVGIIRKNNYEECDVEWNEKEQYEVRNTFVSKARLQYKQCIPVRSQKCTLKSDCHRNCLKLWTRRSYSSRYGRTNDCRWHSNKSNVPAILAEETPFCVLRSFNVYTGVSNTRDFKSHQKKKFN